MSALLQHAVVAQAQARPERVAVVDGGARLAYGELEAQSNRLAHALRGAGCRPGARVALVMPKSAAAIVAVLGTLKAGAACVPLHPDIPAARLARLLELSDCRCLLAGRGAEAALRPALAALAPARRAQLGWLDGRAPVPGLEPAFGPAELAVQPATQPPCTATASDLAQILFTSGSSGAPKGVMITHGGAEHFVRWGRRHFGVTPEDRMSQHAPLRFDISTFDIFGALGAGAELHLVSAALHLQPHRLAELMRTARLTLWFSVPAVLTLMARLDLLAQDDFPALRRVLFAGEVLPTPVLMHWMRRLPHVRFTHLYGPTETTIASSYYDVPRPPQDARAPLPIGTPLPGEELDVLDERLQAVAPGTAGELCIGGQGLAAGYWRDPRRTRAAFVSRPGAARERLYRTGDLACRGEDGLHYYLGRIEHEVSCRGHRVRPGEIEAALWTLPALREVAVVALPARGVEGSLLCCAYAPQPGGHATPQALRRGLAALVPAHLLPSRWLRLESLPRNECGKVDRGALRAVFQQAEARVGEAA